MPKHNKQSSGFTQAALREKLEHSKFSTSDKELENLFIYLELLQKWNKVMNLVGPYSWEKMLDELILDSFHLATFLRTLPLPAEPECWDFGAGAGLPGIPLRILWQQGKYTMVDSREKRILFLQNVLARLVLPATHAQAARVEEFMDKSSPAHLLISRAFMPWQKLLELVAGRLAPKGICVFMALEEAPQILPPTWRIVAEDSYVTAAGTRYFWALTGV